MKLLLIEDNSSIVDFIKIALKLGFPDSKIISTHLGKEGVEFVEKEKPDIVLLDLELPDISGFEVLEQIRAFSEIPIIIETIKDNETDIVRGLTLGADDYIGKPFGQLELIARIRTVLKRINTISTDSLIYEKLYLDISHRTLSHESKSTRLTPTETLLLQTFMKNINKLLTFESLAEIIWGTDYPGSDNTLKVYIRRLRAKVESVSDGTISIISKPGVGFILKTVNS